MVNFIIIWVLIAIGLTLNIKIIVDNRKNKK